MDWTNWNWFSTGTGSRFPPLIIPVWILLFTIQFNIKIIKNNRYLSELLIQFSKLFFLKWLRTTLLTHQDHFAHFLLKQEKRGDKPELCGAAADKGPVRGNKNTHQKYEIIHLINIHLTRNIYKLIYEQMLYEHLILMPLLLLLLPLLLLPLLLLELNKKRNILCFLEKRTSSGKCEY